MAESKSPETTATEYDLTQTITPYLDLHMLFPIFNFLKESKLYNSNDLLRAELEALKSTNMVDAAVDAFKLLNNADSAPEEMKETRANVLSKLTALENDVKPILDVIQDAELVARLQAEGGFTAANLLGAHGVNASAIDALRQYAKFKSDCGDYVLAADCLHYYRLLDPSGSNSFVALWGKLASQLLAQQWEAAVQDLAFLAQAIETNEGSALEQLQQRCWLLHWSLFLLPTHGAEVAELLLQEKFLNALQCNSPWLLRYVAAAVLLSPNRPEYIQKLVTVIEQEQEAYTDPLTAFVATVYTSYDLDASLAALAAVEPLLSVDYFLSGAVGEQLLDKARQMVFDVHFRVHQSVSLDLVASKLGLSAEQTEQWVADLLATSEIDATIDAETRSVVMGAPRSSVYHQVVSRTKDLSFRTYVLAHSVEGCAKEAAAAN